MKKINIVVTGFTMNVASKSLNQHTKIVQLKIVSLPESKI